MQQFFSHTWYRCCGVSPGSAFSHMSQHSLGHNAKLSSRQKSLLSHISKVGHSGPHRCIILGLAAGHLSSCRISFPSMHTISLVCVPPQVALHCKKINTHKILSTIHTHDYSIPFYSILAVQWPVLKV